MGQLRIVEEGAPARSRGRARRGFDQALRAYTDGGRREPIDEAYIALGRISSDELDRACRDPDVSAHVRGALIGRCAAVFGLLFDRGEAGTGGDHFEDLYAALRDAEDTRD